MFIDWGNGYYGVFPFSFLAVGSLTFVKLNDTPCVQLWNEIEAIFLIWNGRICSATPTPSFDFGNPVDTEATWLDVIGGWFQSSLLFVLRIWNFFSFK